MCFEEIAEVKGLRQKVYQNIEFLFKKISVEWWKYSAA
jgi:hypothetical protein